MKEIIVFAFLLPAVAASICGCAGPTPAVFRLIDNDPTTTFDSASMATAVEVFHWGFSEPEDLLPWKCINIDLACRIEDGSLLVQSSSSDPQLVRDLELQAHKIDALQVTLAEAPSADVALFWSRAGQEFRSNRRLFSQRRAGSPAKGPVTLRFSLATEPLWRGKIARLRLDPTSQAREPVRILAVSGIRLLARDTEPGPWKVDLAADIRNAFVALPGQPIEYEVNIPAGAELRFATGLVPGLRTVDPARLNARLGTARLRVLIKPPTGEARELFATAVGPRARHRGRGSSWHEHSIDLSRFAGVRARLILESQSEGLVLGVPAWANPEILVPSKRGSRPGVILISIDTLRADRLSLNGHSRPTSPHIDAWAHRRAVNFINAIAPSPWTLPSHLSLLSGLNPITHGVNHDVAIPPALTLLAEQLRDSGYGTAAITGRAFLHPRFGFTQGFDRYTYWPAQKAAEEELASGVRLALRWLARNQDRPFFLFLHTYEVHHPYRAREPFYSRFETRRIEELQRITFRPVGAELWGGRIAADTGLMSQMFFLEDPKDRNSSTPLPRDLLPVLGARYDSGVAYADNQIGHLLEGLEEMGLAESTLVVLTSDHGESLGEDNRASHYHLYEENLRVPLIIAFPRALPAGREVSRQVSLVDIVPTVLELTGLTPATSLDGRSLVPAARGEDSPGHQTAVSYASHTGRGLSLRIDNRLKYIFNNTAFGPASGRRELYDLERDPNERFNLASERPEQLQALHRRAHQILRRSAGIWLRFDRPSDGMLTGIITGLNPTRVKVLDRPANPLVLSRNQLEFTVSTDSRLLLWVENHGPLPFTVRGAWRQRGSELSFPFYWTIEPNSLTNRRNLVLDTASWREVEGAPLGEHPRISIWRQGPAPASDTLNKTDEQIRRELRALGYFPGP